MLSMCAKNVLCRDIRVKSSFDNVCVLKKLYSYNALHLSFQLFNWQKCDRFIHRFRIDLELQISFCL